MVQTIVLPERTYKYPLELVVKAYDMRYPKCSKMAFLLDSEVVEEREVDGVRMLVRRCHVKMDIPFLIKKIAGSDTLTFRQEYRHDRKARCLHVQTRNESFAERLSMNEKCIYSVHPENADWTRLQQKATLDIESAYGIEGLVERAAIRQYRINLEKSWTLIEEFIQDLLADKQPCKPSHPSDPPSPSSLPHLDPQQSTPPMESQSKGGVFKRHFQRKNAKSQSKNNAVPLETVNHKTPSVHFVPSKLSSHHLQQTTPKKTLGRLRRDRQRDKQQETSTTVTGQQQLPLVHKASHFQRKVLEALALKDDEIDERDVHESTTLDSTSSCHYRLAQSIPALTSSPLSNTNWNSLQTLRSFFGLSSTQV